MSGTRALVKSVLVRITNVFGDTRVGRFVSGQLAANSMSRTRAVEHGATSLKFCVPNGLNHDRAATFSTKEPETLRWLDSIPEKSVLWDVGANVGLYTCYAAKARGCRVISFEPSVFNLELLARNVFINGLTELVTLVPLPLFETVSSGVLNMSTTTAGGALSTFKESYGFDGQPLEKVFEVRTVGLPLDAAEEFLGLPQPDYLKIDVDGIEHLVLRGGGRVLARVKGVSIEINDAFDDQASESARLLRGAGLALVGKEHAEMFEKGAEAYRHTFNQVWERR
jgi:FkbM family methyltransferase